jgi:hypothetical protein
MNWREVAVVNPARDGCQSRIPCVLVGGAEVKRVRWKRGKDLEGRRWDRGELKLIVFRKVEGENLRQIRASIAIYKVKEGKFKR